jgi:micrococcal nuclease
MKKKVVIGLIALVAIVAVLIFVGCLEEESVPTPTPLITPSPTATSTPALETTSAIVSKIIDGDTIKLQNGDKVRLLGINTPEMGQPYYEEATDRLKELIEGKTVALEKDIEDKDQYERLLRYIYIDDTFVNLEMVREGYANVYLISPKTKYSDEFEKAEEEAKIAGRGIWQPSEGGLSKCIGILYFQWNAEGNDCYNLNDEYVTFKNTCSQSIDMTGWTVKDDANHIYTFPHFNLAGGATVTLYTGSGKDTITELYWDSSGHSCNAIWNNDGDTLYLRDITGNLVISYSYSGFE